MNGVKKYRGVVVPMVSPFTKQGEVDSQAAQKITKHLVAAGISPFVLGTTGEGLSMSNAQRTKLVEAAVCQSDKKATVYAGISHLCLSESIELAKTFFDIGVDAVVCQLPSYYPLSRDGILRYYDSLATKIPGPLLLYNIPLTTHLSIPLEVIDTLSHHPNIVGFKDSEDDPKRLAEAVTLWKNREDFSHFIGVESLAVQGLSLGCDGIVPSTGNVIPKLYQKLYTAAVSGDLEMAQALWEKTLETSHIYLKNKPLNHSLPALKTIMNIEGFCEAIPLPPLCPTSSEEKVTIKKQLKARK